jgi:Ca2+-binding RTX toxin-like protein
VVETSPLGGIDSVVANVNAYTLTENTEWLILDAAVAVGTGNSSANTLIGNVLANTLNGGAGNDSMIGSFGNDYYIVDSLSDKVIESLGGGTDSVLAELSGYTLSGNTEWLILGSTAATGFGNSLGNTLVGNSLDNTLDGGAGADSLAGGKGNDVYIVNDAENAISEAADSGVDTVISSASFTLGLNLEKLTLTGTAVAGFGNSLANTIIGNSVANTLDGGTGNDSLIGGAGNDYYTIDSLSDEVVEASLNGGVDSVFSKISGYTLESNVEVLILGNSVAAGTGNSIANTLIGNSAANTLNGGAGVDSLLGLTGNDYYIIDSLADKVFEAVNAGTDSVLTQVTGYTLAGNTEWLILASSIEYGTGNSLANTLIGNSTANTLDGALGNDLLVGLAGDDYYIVDSLSDVVFESLNGGLDSVIANVRGYTLAGNVEWLSLASTIAAGTGNALANTLVGNSAANTLDGGAGNDAIDGGAGNDWLNGGLGNDTLVGGLGNDYYIVDSLTDVLVESSTLGGIDSVSSTVSHSLNDNLEVLILSGTAASGTGNSLANTLLGNSLANTLDGGAGNDSLAGLAGNDFYIVDSLLDKVFEAVNAGTDSILAQINDYTLAGNTEWLRLDAGIAKGTGNSLANTLLGNSIANTLDGGIGSDSLIGGEGDDYYTVDNLTDSVLESLNGGIDSVVASVSGYTLSGNVEWLRLDSTIGAGIGNSLANTILGNASANTLDGGSGNDSLVGLAGNDFYIIDSLSDEVVESTLAGGGVDSVQAKVSGYTLVDNTEVLILAGTVGVGTGNSLANTLIGNSVGNTLDGGLGNDSLIGLAGNDYYKINSLTDIVVEAANGGIDSVLANVNGYTLTGNTEWLILDSTIASGTGNSLANTLLGNAEDNTLNGGLGSDSLIGGAGDDYYIIDSTSDVVLESVSSGTDSILANLSVYTLAGNAEVLILGTGTTGIGNILNNTLIGNSLSNLLTGNTGDDSLFGFSGDDNLTGCTNLATGGKGEKDTLTGGIGSDIFNLGSALGVFYNDGVAGNTGEADFAYITDFTVGKDILKLKGTALQYSLGDHTVAGLTSYKGLYYETGTTDELIAIIQPASGTLDITSLMANAQFV